ncbi:chaperone protein ClpB3, chloroplastic-like [Mercurialis annua]|uniref:chaperone protein ClpB3, chloroplastic-like n=1 Tax=Mercurialis annua TaxID=3986 RepID=UPI0021603676|nr:chaperone protein ClpB3, chloroplastic-like [Mercurialis annua]
MPQQKKQMFSWFRKIKREILKILDSNKHQNDRPLGASTLNPQLQNSEKEFAMPTEVVDLSERTRLKQSRLQDLENKPKGIRTSLSDPLPLFKPEEPRMQNLEIELNKRVMGQDHAVEDVATGIWRTCLGWSKPGRPIASFMFMGPDGVAKTRLAESLASYLFSTDDALIRINMNEFTESKSALRLIGAPTGSSGYQEGGHLTEIIHRRPNAVILFDEMEKAHFNVRNLCCRILDSGRLTDLNGRTASFTNTIIIMTTNVGSEHTLETDDKLSKKLAYEAAGRLVFRRALMDAVDELVVFQPSNRD